MTTVLGTGPEDPDTSGRIVWACRVVETAARDFERSACAGKRKRISKRYNGLAGIGVCDGAGWPRAIDRRRSAANTPLLGRRRAAGLRRDRRGRLVVSVMSVATFGEVSYALG